MCGICGILAYSDSFACDEEVVGRMADVIAHRGPDDSGTWSRPDQRIALGHRRLSIVDLSPAGHNPMPNEDGSVWITFNGEIYNHASLRSELERKGHVYRSRTDTETILHLYEEEGPACVERLHGMFAIAIWDSRERELFLARDRLGIKPLYYAPVPGGLLFGSEIKALLEHPALSAELDEEAFHHYLTFVATPAPLTMFKGVRKLAPAERMLVRADGSMHIERWWSPMSPSAAEEVAGLDEAGMRERVMELLRASIAKRMMSDVPFGVFLSGGVDSSTNVALMSELMDDPVRTFSVGFKEHERYNELDHARRVAQLFKPDHHEVMIDSDDLVDFLPELIHHQDEPIADWVCVPLYYVAKLARDSGTIVVQVGEGSDELFHGYQLYLNEARRQRLVWEPFSRLPRPLRLAASASASAVARRTGRGVPHAAMLAEAAHGRQAFWGGAIAYQGALKDEVLGNGGAHADSYEVVRRLWSEAERQWPQADLLQKMTYLE